VAPENKERLIEQGFGKNNGQDLFLSREILALTDISISEEGRPGEGASFEIMEYLVGKGYCHRRTDIGPSL